MTNERRTTLATISHWYDRRTAAIIRQDNITVVVDQRQEKQYRGHTQNDTLRQSIAEK